MRAFVFAALGTAASFAASAQTYTTFDVKGADTHLKAVALDGTGTLLGSYQDVHGVMHAFLRAPTGKIKHIDVAGAGQCAICGTLPEGLSSKGIVAGTMVENNGNAHGFIRAKNGTVALFDVPGSEGQTVVTGIDDKGNVYGWYNLPARACFVRKPDGTFSSYDPNDLPGCTSVMTSGTGQTAGYAYDSQAQAEVAFLRSPKGKVTAFRPFSAPSSEPLAINDGGDIVGFYYDRAQKIHGYLRDSGGSVTRFDVPGAAFAATAIAANGIIYGLSFDSMGRSHGFIKDRGDAVLFDVPGAVTTEPRVVNANGTVAGDYGDSNGDWHFFLRN
ncbi:MAG: hypothetical protein JOZ72_01170 [Alphaproteobacteria bacterium]|nr:hypothetical protein [Alphaproteobacteria bacterium]